MWERREIENYLCYPETLEAYARATSQQATVGPLFSSAESQKRLKAMQDSIDEISEALKTLGKGSPWDPDMKVSDDFLTRLFEAYFEKLDLPNIMRKTNFHELAGYVPTEKLDPEIKEKLDAIVEVAQSANPAEETS